MDKEDMKNELAALGRELLLAMLSTAAAILTKAAIHYVRYGSLLNQPTRSYQHKPSQRRYAYEDEEEELDDDDDDDEQTYIKWS